MLLVLFVSCGNMFQGVGQKADLSLARGATRTGLNETPGIGGVLLYLVNAVE